MTMGQWHTSVPLLLASQYEIHAGYVADIARVLWPGPPELSDQRVLHPEDGVTVEVRIVRVKDVRGDRSVPGCGNDGMDMGGPPMMPPCAGQEAADRAVGRDRVADRTHGAELVGAVGPGHEHAAEIEGRLLRVLGVIEPVASALPDVQGGAIQRFTLAVGHVAADQGGFTVFRSADLLTHFANRRPRDVERSQDG